MSTHAPYYRWFPKDYSSDPYVQGMTDDQDLAYRRMLDASWELGGLPNDPVKLAAIVRYEADRFEAAWTYPLTECWEPLGRRKMLVNNRQESERQLFLSKRTKGRDAANERWKKQRKRMGIKEKSYNRSALVEQCGRNADAMRNGCLPDPDPNPNANVAKQDLLSPVTTKPVSNVVASSEKSELAPNPFHFVVYWKDATASNDFALRVEPRVAFLEFVAMEARRLEIRMNGADLERFFRRSETRFLATYSKRVGRNGKARGNAIGPKRLTEELVGWIRSDLANMGNRQAQGGSKSRAQRIDDQVQRRLHSGKQGNS